MSRMRWPVLVLLFAAAIAAPIGSAPIGSAQVGSAQVGASELDLGGGVRVRRAPRYCQGGSVGSGCFAWEPVGFTFGSDVGLAFAQTFARVPSTGRILAALPLASTLYSPIPYATRLMRTDDLGEHWTPVAWRWAETVTVLAFDAEGGGGVAAGDSGYLWATTDGGITWTEHGSSAGTTYVELAIHDGVVVARDSNGNVYRAPHGNFDRELVVTDRGARVSVEGDAVVVRTSDALYSLRRGRATERTRR